MTDTNTPSPIEPWEPNSPATTNEEPPAAAPVRSRRKRNIAIVGGAAAVIGLGAIAAPVLAQTIGDHDGDHDGKHEQFEQELAQKLGVPQSKVDDALKSMQGDRLGQRIDELQQSGALTADQATAIKGKLTSGDVKGAMLELRTAMMTTQLATLVEKGTITQAQADQVTALTKAGVPVGLRVPPAGEEQQPEHVESAAHQERQVQELQQRGALTAAQAKTITDLIAANKTAEAETAIHAAMDAGMLKQLVQDGKVTQAQADQIAALQAAGVPIGIGGPGMHGGPGMGGHHGPDMDGDHDMRGDHDMDGDRGMDGDHGFDGPPMDGGQQGQSGGSQSGQYQPQTYGANGSA